VRALPPCCTPPAATRPRPAVLSASWTLPLRPPTRRRRRRLRQSPRF